MKAEQYLLEFFHEKLKITKSHSQRIVKLIVKDQTVSSIKEGANETSLSEKRHAN